jgi:hypothetical protein
LSPPFLLACRPTGARFTTGRIKERSVRLVGAGGTPGGTGQFFLGLGLAVVGAYLLTQRVEVSSFGYGFGGFSPFGLSLIPFVLGIGLLFFDGGSRWGFLLMFAGVAIIFAGIIMNMNIYFRATSLFDTLMMLGILAAGIGLVIRSLR